MQHTKRPSLKELDGKLRGAKEAIKKGKRLFAEPEKIFGEINALNLGDAKEVWELILNLLPEITSKDYEGRRPPEKAYEKGILGKELFPFCWNSNLLKKRMYLKFVLDCDIFYYVSLHESKFDGE